MLQSLLNSSARVLVLLYALTSITLYSCGSIKSADVDELNAGSPNSQASATDSHPTIKNSAFAEHPGSAEHVSSQGYTELQYTPLPVIQKLMAFQDSARNGTKYTEEQLQQEMDSFIQELDALAVRKNSTHAREIIASLESAQRGAILNAQLTDTGNIKGIWLKWSERLFLTRDALRHFFSEILLNGFEKSVDLNNFQDSQQFEMQLNNVLHRDHERRLISIIRRLDESSPHYLQVLDLLITSGGPLSRLYLYQKFITQPSVTIATALSKVGMPRISDLIGKSPHLTDRILFGHSRMNEETENFLGDKLQDFRGQWTEFKRYFEELKQIPERHQQARVKWTKLHEEISYIVNLITADSSTKEKLRKDLLQTFNSSQSPWEHVYRHDGIEFRQGDIILLQTGPVGGLWETLTQSGSLLSHLMMVHFGKDGLPLTVEMNYGQLLVAPLDLYADRYTVIRPTGLTPSDRMAIYHAIASLVESDLRYDFKFDLKSSDRLYCSELVSAVFKKAGLTRSLQTFTASSEQAASLFAGAGIRTRDFYTQGSYIGGLGFSAHGERLNADPRDYIRGLLVLDGFSKYVSGADSVKLSRHPEANQLFALATLAQTVTPGVRRALGPPRFLFTALVLDQLINKIEEEARRAQIREPSDLSSLEASRIVELKRVINRSLSKTIPQHLSEIFPGNDHNSLTPAR